MKFKVFIDGGIGFKEVKAKEIDDGYAEYEGEIFYDGTEYEFEISASDGSILSWEIDRD